MSLNKWLFLYTVSQNLFSRQNINKPVNSKDDEFLGNIFKEFRATLGSLLSDARHFGCTKLLCQYLRSGLTVGTWDELFMERPLW